MIDANLIFDGTAPNTGAAITVTRVSGNVIDLLANRDVGAAGYLEIIVGVLTTFTAGGAATLQIAMQGGNDSTAAANYDLLFSPTYALSALTAGKQLFRAKMPMYQENEVGGIGKPGRYLNLKYTVTTGPFTAGAVFAYLAGADDRDIQQSYQYPANYAITA